MKRTLLALSILFAEITSFPAHGDLYERFQLEKLGTVSNAPLVQALSGYQVVFVGFSDFLTWINGFSDNIDALSTDLRLTNVKKIDSLFFGSYDLNATLLSAEFRKIYVEGGGKPLIVIGNPQSGPYSLYTLLMDPSLADGGVVRALILLTPAFGSPLADMLSTRNGGDNELSKFTGEFFGDQIKKFKSSVARPMFEQAVEGLTDNQRNTMSSKLYYVRGSSSLLHATPFFTIPYSILRPHGETDGITYTKDQVLAGFGVDLGIVPANHWDLFAAEPAVTTPASYRKAFTRAVLKEVLGL